MPTIVRPQQEAIETLVYVNEAAQVRRRKALLEQFAAQAELQQPLFNEYALLVGSSRLSADTGCDTLLATAVPILAYRVLFVAIPPPSHISLARLTRREEIHSRRGGANH